MIDYTLQYCYCEHSCCTFAGKIAPPFQKWSNTHESDVIGITQQTHMRVICAQRIERKSALVDENFDFSRICCSQVITGYPQCFINTHIQYRCVFQREISKMSEVMVCKNVIVCHQQSRLYHNWFCNMAK